MTVCHSSLEQVWTRMAQAEILFTEAEVRHSPAPILSSSAPVQLRLWSEQIVIVLFVAQELCRERRRGVHASLAVAGDLE